MKVVDMAGVNGGDAGGGGGGRGDEEGDGGGGLDSLVVDTVEADIEGR